MQNATFEIVVATVLIASPRDKYRKILNKLSYSQKYTWGADLPPPSTPGLDRVN